MIVLCFVFGADPDSYSSIQAVQEERLARHNRIDALSEDKNPVFKWGAHDMFKVI